MGHLVTALGCSALVVLPATALAQQGAFSEGLRELTAAIVGSVGDEGPRIGPALDKMSRGLAAWDDEIRSLEDRVAAPPTGAEPAADLRATLALAYARRGRLPDALRELDAACRSDPRRADLHTQRGLVLEASGRAAEASEAFLRAWSLDPRDPGSAYQLLRHPTAGNAADLERARENLAAAYDRLLNETARPGRVAFSVSQLGAADTADAPVIPPASWSTGYAHIARGALDQAVVVFRHAAETDPLLDDPAIRSGAVKQAAAALVQGRLDEARAALERSDARSSEAQRLLGLVFWADSQFDRSVEALKAAVAVNPVNERAHLVLARVLTTAGRHAEAERTLLDTLRVIPASSQARWWLGRGYEQLNRFADARVEFERAEPAVVAGRSAFFITVGRLASSAADGAAATDALEHAVLANPGAALAHKLLGTAYVLQDRADDALVELIAAALLDPKDPGAHTGIGQIHLNAGRYAPAVAALRQAVGLAPGYTEARYALGTALRRMGRTDESAHELERVALEQRETLAIRRRTISLDALKEEAALRLAEGNHERGVALWREALAREPDHASTHLGLAAALVGAGEPAAAIQHYERALALGASAEVSRDLAVLYERAGRAEEAARARIVYERSRQNAARAPGAPR